MGYLAEGRCVETVAEAADLVWSTMKPTLDGGSPSIVTLAQWSGTAWNLNSYQSGALISTQVAPALGLASCDSAAAALDGLALGWLVLGVWVVAWGIHVLRRGLGWGF